MSRFGGRRVGRGEQPRELRGQVVAVTGAARGIGAMLARRLSERGARVALLGLEPAELAAVAAECGPDAKWWEVDVTDADAITRVAAQVEDHFGGVDILIANAGIATGGPVLIADARSYDRVIEVNLLGSIRTARAFLPALVSSHGYLLQIASVAAIVPAPMMSAYCASKSGVEAFAHAMRPELGHHGVDVGVAYLSWTDTDMVRGADARTSTAGSRAELPGVFGRTYPLGPAVDALVDGIARRAPHIYAQGWLRVLPWVRGALPAILGRVGGPGAQKAEAAFIEAGPEATMPVGAGGEADSAARKG